jgi:parallel beta-helix repeat protein
MSERLRFLFLLFFFEVVSNLVQSQVTVSNCEIQTAINNCRGSCTILVSPGTCRLGAALSWAGTGKRVDLECAGRNQTALICPPGVQCVNLDSNSRIAHCDLRGPGIPSANALINGQKSSGTTTDVVIEDNIIELSSDQGLNSGGNARRWTIRNNTFRNNIGDGIYLASGTSDSVISDNIVINNGSNGIDCNGSGNSFHGNISNGNGRPGGDIDKNGILISGIANGSSADHNSLLGNETNYNGGSGINIRADLGTTANYNTVSGNVSHDNAGTHNNSDGISIDGSDLGTWIGNALVGNTVYHNQRYGIEVDGQNATMIQGTVISSNIAIANGNTGIIVGNAKVQDTLIVHNIALDNGSAQITDLGTTRTIIAGNKENASDSAYLIRNDLIANTIASMGPNLSFETPAGSVGANMTDSGMWSFPGGMSIGGGLSNDGTGLKHQSVATDVVGPGLSTVVTLNWPTPFPDSNYDPQCSVVDASRGTAAIRIHHIQSFTSTAVVVQVVNDDPRFPHSGTLYCLGIHQLAGTAARPSLNLGIFSGRSSSASIPVGGMATYALSIGGGGVGGTASLVCTGAPVAATCVVPNTQLVNASVPTVFYARVTTSSPTASAINPVRPVGWGWFSAPAVLGLTGLSTRQRRRKLQLIWVIPAALLFLLCACGISRTGTNQFTPPGTYSLTVTAVSGSLSQSTALVLTVQ